MSGFPINLDLSEYFEDLRKYSCVFVNLSKFKDVGDVENHIKTVFGLEDNICLLNKKFLIPRNEDIQILQQYDMYKVQKSNFYDLQIHKSKKVNSNSFDQNALNLTQSEKTIDLSCRPKQRLKANVCQSPATSGTPSLHVNSKTSVDSQKSSARTLLCVGDQNVSREKQKHRKKRHVQSDESDDDTASDANILDMSVRSSKRNKHSNCFSTDDGSFLSENVNESNNKDNLKDLHKKSKRRKKHSEGLDEESTDLASTSWRTLLCDEADSKDQNSKKKTRKANLNGGSTTNKSDIQDEVDSPVELYSNYSVTEEGSVKKKHKHNKKNSESKCFNDSQENQYYSNSSLNVSKNHSLNKSSISKTYYDDKFESESSRGEDQRKSVKVDQINSESLQNNSDTNSQTDKDGDTSGIVENIKPESFQEYDCTNHKRKRKRKHNKKKKRENLLYMFAVGPALNQLASQKAIAKPSPTSENAKHVFFTEEDFVEDMKIPSTPQSIQDSSKTHESHAELTLCQPSSSSTPETWQHQLLKLASTNSKPVVFNRNSTVSVTNKTAASTQQPSQEHSKDAVDSNQSSCNRSDFTQGKEVNPTIEDFQRCNGEVKSENGNEDKSCSVGTVNGSNPRKGLPDMCKPLPIPNDLQNINLTDYPIIDKVVAEDLILFKVVKLNENSEPGVSKPILAKVNESSVFPDRISLQIMEGCEECSHCTQAEHSSETITIELRWSDILEPRLFYP